MQLLEFEKNIAKLQRELDDIAFSRARAEEDGKDLSKALEDKEAKIKKQMESSLVSIYSKISAWDKQLVARHLDRPHAIDYINTLIEDFTPMAGDRYFGDDNSIIGGLGMLDGVSVMVIGQEKGRTPEEKIKHNFAMPKPEGYRKARRLMELADKYNIPVITFVDTAGAYPGMDAEARGQAEAIAQSISSSLNIKVPFISVIIGEGGSGGAIAIASSNTIIMPEHSIYSVISPEGCASILWRSQEYKDKAAKALKITAQDLKKLGVIDTIVPEPVGGAHRNPEKMIEDVGVVLSKEIAKLSKLSRDDLKKHKEDKFMKMTRL